MKRKIMENRKQHWDQIYEDKAIIEESWYEPMPEISLKSIDDCELDKGAAIIDVGGGDSFLAEFLVAKGHTDISVLDISETALERAKKRLAEKADGIQWLVQDILDFIPEKQYDLWHDRAAFHFLGDDEQVERYLQVLKRAVKPGGFVVLGTFSDKGPEKCSGLKVKRYSVAEMQKLFSEGFINLSCKNVDHKTPSGKIQNFTFCSFRKEE